MSWKPSDLPDLSGTTAVVTGANSGIGLITAKELAAKGAHVVLAVRNVESGQQAAAKMSGQTRVEKLDLSSQASVKEFVERWDGPLDLLINNAGVMRPPTHRTTEDGFELQFGTNHLGHFTLTAGLLPHLLKTKAPRVVTVASIAHHGGNASVVQGNPAEGYEPAKSYSQTKLANVLFAKELQRRATAANSKLVSTAAHPGVSSTGLITSPDGMGANTIVRRIAPLVMPLVLQSAAAGANPTLYAAAEGKPGSYTGPQRLGESRGPIGEAKVSKYARDEQLAADLWDATVRLTGVDLTF